MSCTDCFNGCTKTTPDKCVKYTGPDVPELNIEKGDNLTSVENNIILKILSIMIGESIFPDIAPEVICTDIQTYLPGSAPYDLNAYLTSIIRVVCIYGGNIQTITDNFNALNSEYVLDCVTSFVEPEDTANTHAVLQGVINLLCITVSNLQAINLNLTTNYVAIEDLDGYIEAYLESVAPSNLISNKMIPFVAVEYYGTLANFNAGGAGIGDWVNVYLCNGANGTPDKRGVAPVGVTTVTGGGAYNPAVDPGNPANPNYVLNTPLGANNIALTSAQMPAHIHTSTVTIIESPHTHLTVNGSSGTSVLLTNTNPINSTAFYGNDNSYSLSGVSAVANVGLTSPTSTGITATATVGSTGGGDAHSNIQPVLPCYYIMHIPA